MQVLVPADRGTPAVVRSPDVPALVVPPSSRSSGSPTATTSPLPSTSSASARPAVTVLNNSRVTGLAAKAAADFARAGWPTAGTGNLTGRLALTTVYYPAGQRAAAEELRRRFPAIRDMAPRYAGLPGSGLTVVVTRDYPH